MPAQRAENAQPPESSTLADWLNISHELRTPVHAVLGHAELLLSGMLGPLSSEMRSSIGSIQKAGIDLMAQIDEAIDVGQALSLCERPMSGVERLVQIMVEARANAEPNSERSAPERHSPWERRWFRIAALALSECRLQTDHRDSRRPSLCDIDNSRRSELQFDCEAVDRSALSAYVKIIELAMMMIGGSVRLDRHHLVLSWTSKEFHRPSSAGGR